MSLITRCPACRTMFKVVPDQLRISEGWVRCGQCDEVFDASANLQDPQRVEVPQQEPVDIEFETPAADELSVPEMVPDQQTPVEVTPAPIEPVLDALSGVGAASSPAVVETDELDAALEPEWQTEPVESLAPSFLRKAHERARVAASPRRRIGWLLAVTFLGLTLLVQLLMHERDRIVATAPGFKPVVEVVCALLQCSVAPLRQIESILIESSSFNKLRTDVYRLNLTLKNAAGTDVALPAIELSLTDAQDQALMRRVFLANELGVPSEVLVMGSEAEVSLALSVKTNGNAEWITGYRVLAFYP